ncbi:energy transducer TonB [Cellvibrio zantedeschiae]|nr:energy transducer TonB [Cellvibrio zantedeschiae]
MKSKYAAHYSLLIVVLVHFAVLGAVLLARQAAAPVVIELPTIQGMIVSSEPVTKPLEPTPPPPPEQKPVVAPKIPLPKAPASDRAIQQEAQPEPAPPVDNPVKSAEPTSAPVVPPQADASHLNNPAPVYPTQSRRLREQGTVVLEVLVKADGSLGDLRLKTSSGSDRLDEAALRAVKNWHFVPAKRGSESIDFWYELPIEFSLNR